MIGIHSSATFLFALQLHFSASVPLPRPLL
jgi:hypothetical protein